MSLLRCENQRMQQAAASGNGECPRFRSRIEPIRETPTSTEYTVAFRTVMFEKSVRAHGDGLIST
jgi:hypothetical protein